MRVIILLLCIGGLIAGCKSKQKVQRDLSQVKITVGEGGGFTGFHTSYVIYGTGMVERYTTKDNKTEQVKSVPLDSVRVWVNRMDQINFTGIELDQPGNMSYYMELQEPSKTHSIRWGGAVPPAAVQDLFDRIKKTVMQ
jgi:hypothetical protein